LQCAAQGRKDKFGGNTIIVKGDVKVMARLMFGILAPMAD
jgi:hypothetical protein